MAEVAHLCHVGYRRVLARVCNTSSAFTILGEGLAYVTVFVLFF